MSSWEVGFRLKHTQCNHKDDPNREAIKTSIQTILSSNPLLQVLDNTLKITKKAQGKGKSIGSDFERKVVKILSEWWSVPLRRTPNSGGWDKQVNDGTTVTSGDIYSAPGIEFPFCIECKHRKEDLNLFSIQKKGTDGIFDWWNQCTRDALVANKIPLLIMACGRTDFVAFRDGLVADFWAKRKNTNNPIVSIYRNDLVFHVMLLEHFVDEFKKSSDLWQKKNL